jgi:hypothetical protein
VQGNLANHEFAWKHHGSNIRLDLAKELTRICITDYFIGIKPGYPEIKQDTG